MKTRISIALSFILLTVAFCANGATEVVKISAFPNTATMNDSDLLLLAVPGVTNKNITWGQFKAQIGTNGSTINNFQFITNITLYSTNIDVTYITNNTEYTTNLYATTEFVSNAYFTNITVNNGYITNLYVTQITTNFALFNTNVYFNDTFVSNYFITNVFQDTFMTNFFQTNIIFYETNNYQEFISTTNFIDYITNSYVSNFFNTNIFVNNNYVSNYFTTNYNPLIQITSNYTYNIAWPLTNATLYGTTTFSPISGFVPGVITVLNNNVEAITLNGSNSAVTANTMFFKLNSWAGPTNTIDMNVEDQGYASFTPVSITGLINRSNSVVQSVMLTLTNQSASNWTLTMPTSLKIPERTNQVTVSNNSLGMISIRYHPTFGSNGVYRQF